MEQGANDIIEYLFLDKKQVESEEYKVLQQKIHGPQGYISRKKRIDHYAESADFRLLVAVKNGQMIGQASAFKVMAIIENKEQPLYWGCDTFLLSESRGLGIGKQLQYKLHQICPNFSSAWYSPINGIIKKKCGCTSLIDLKFTYYPVSIYWGIFEQLISAKICKKRLALNLSLPYFYYKINNFFHKNKLNSYAIEEVQFENINQEISDFMEEALAMYDFHIKRSLEFLKWAYGWKKGQYHMLAIKKEKQIKAIVAFSEIHNATHVVARFHGISILDLVVHPKEPLTKKDILLYVIKFYKQQKRRLDGLITFEQMNYFPKFIYPWPSSPLLSTYGKKVSKGYLSFIDQDMDQL